MKKKSDVHEALYLIFQQTGVSYKMVVDGSKEQVLGDFQKKNRKQGAR